MERYSSVSVFKRKTGWQARLRYKEGNKWKELSKMLPGVKGKKEATQSAETLRRELNEQARKGASTNLADKTVDEVVLGYLDYQLSVGAIEKSTYSRQKQSYNSAISPYLGDYTFESLDRTAVVDWHTKLAEKGYKPQSIYSLYQIVSKVYMYYIENEEISRNPFKQANKMLHARAKKVDVTHLTSEQMEKFITSVFLEYEPSEAMYAGLVIMAYAGLRRGEVLGLRWSDIDFASGTISVNTAIGKGEGGCYTKDPKNKASIRTFPMIEQLAYCLRLRYNAIQPRDNWFVVSDHQEKFMAVSTFGEKTRKFYDKYGLVDAYDKPVQNKGMRHNFATVGIRANMDIASLSLMMGHANRAMTLNTYADANEQSKQLGAKRMSETFAKETNDGDFFPRNEEESV